jgi:cell division protein FtsI/penicillin-binding protein 2
VKISYTIWLNYDQVESKKVMHQRSIPEKANKILQILFVILLLILARVWYLAILKHDEGLEQAAKPPRKTITLKPARATIRDRFNTPLALNKIQYNASISYSQIKTIPSISWEKDESGNRQKVYKRKNYIKELSEWLAKEISLDALRIEDLIHAKAALLGSANLVIKEDISEEEYFRLKMKEKDFPGLLAEKTSKRFYPFGYLASDIIGFMGAINREEYDKIVQEIQELKNFLSNYEEGIEENLAATIKDPKIARKRLKELQEKAYTIQDFVGKSGIEAQFDETLKGYLGKQVFFSDIHGHLLREMPQSKPQIPGQRLLLTISVELQELAEALLAENEELREGKSIKLDKSTYTFKSIKQPWIKGGTIIAMDPNNGEILALASYPRFDPNDFIPSKDPSIQKKQRQKVFKWLESEKHIGSLWDQKEPLTRERYNFSGKKFYDESKTITWENYLKFILHSSHPVYLCLENYGQIKHAIKAQRGALENTFKELTDFDKNLLIDLYKLAVNAENFSCELLEEIGNKSLNHYRQVNAAFANVQDDIMKVAREHFSKNIFLNWRKDNEKEFLQEKRNIEKSKKLYPKPYIDYLDKEELRQFNQFWQENRLQLIALYLNNTYETLPILDSFKEVLSKQKIDEEDELQSPHFKLLQDEFSNLHPLLVLDYLKTLRTFEDLNEPLIGKYPGLRSFKGLQLQKHLAAAFYPKHGFGYGRSYAYRQAVQVGSVFKVLTAYTALTQPYKHNFYTEDYEMTQKELNPLTIIDDLHKAKIEKQKLSTWNVGYTIDGKPISQHYKGGRIPRSQHSHIGKVGLLEAMETSSNPYFALLAGDVIESPQDILDTARLFSYGERTGINLPGEIKGSLPKDLLTNKTGLYSFAIGQHSFVSTPLQTAVMLSAIANKGKVLEPNIVYLKAGKNLVHEKNEIFSKFNYAYKDSLKQIGINFPIFTESILAKDVSSVAVNAANVRRIVFMPSSIRNQILESMQQVIHGSKGTARASQIRSFAHRPQILQDFTDLSSFMVGKTSTAELQERVDISKDGLSMVNHIGFAAISFEDSKNKAFCFERPELVVVIYLRFGDYGKEAAPMAATIIKKWREIKKRQNELASN